MMNKTKHKKLKLVLLIFSTVILTIFASFGVTIAVVYNKYNLDTNALTQVNNGVKVFSSSGVESTLYNTKRSVVDIDELPDYVKNAFISIEDKRFYKHNGYDLKRIAKALQVNLTSGSKAQGASTISQQLIKNALLTNKKSYSRKIEEIILSIKMEKKYSKQNILEMYLNTIYFGQNAYGIQNASLTYFNKPAQELTLNEACCLAGLIKSPALYSPINNLENCVKRKNLVANAMFKENYIDKNQLEEVVNTELKVNTNYDLDFSYEKEAIYESCGLLGITERELINRNYSILTFKDDNLQNEVKSENKQVLQGCEKKYNTNLDSVSIILDNEGKVRSYYGYSKYNLHNMRRQPASTLKPLAVYLPSITHNICTPSSYILDDEINYNGFKPQNADKKFHGYVTINEALKNSYNIPAVKLLDSVSVKNAQNTLSLLGINTTKQDANLALALGAVSNGVTLNELTTAYSVLANGGVNHAMNFVDKIIDAEGNVIYEYQPFSQTLFDEGDCYLVTDMLKDTAITGSAKKLNTTLPVASKTGTATVEDRKTDIYNVAYTTEHTILTWVGNIANNKLPNEMYSSVEPTKINGNILLNLYKTHAPADFIKPDNIESYAYDLIEAEDNHRIVAPTTNLDRYIGYGYFKKDYPPYQLDDPNKLNLNVTITKYGANINFNAKRNKNYLIYKKLNGNSNIFAEINEQSGIIELTDNDIFKHNEIEYFLVDNNKNSSEIIKIRPKDYLINQINNEALSNKKRWFV